MRSRLKCDHTSVNGFFNWKDSEGWGPIAKTHTHLLRISVFTGARVVHFLQAPPLQSLDEEVILGLECDHGLYIAQQAAVMPAGELWLSEGAAPAVGGHIRRPLKGGEAIEDRATVPVPDHPCC